MIVTKYSSPHIYHSLFNRALPPLSLLLPIVVTTRPDHHHHPSAHHIVRNHCEYSYSCTFEYLEQYLPDDLSSTQMESIIIVIRQGGKNNHPEANLVHGLIWKSTKACKPAKIIHNLRFKIPISSDADADGLFFKCRVGIKGKVEQGWLTQLNASEWELHESIHTIPFCKRGFCFHSHPHLQVFPAPSWHHHHRPILFHLHVFLWPRQLLNGSSAGDRRTTVPCTLLCTIIICLYIVFVFIIVFVIVFLLVGWAVLETAKN